MERVPPCLVGTCCSALPCPPSPAPNHAPFTQRVGAGCGTGYGAPALTSHPSRFFATGYALLSVAALAQIFAAMTAAKKEARWAEAGVRRHPPTLWSAMVCFFLAVSMVDAGPRTTAPNHGTTGNRFHFFATTINKACPLPQKVDHCSSKPTRRTNLFLKKMKPRKAATEMCFPDGRSE